jgi:hypothetical protein
MGLDNNKNKFLYICNKVEFYSIYNNKYKNIITIDLCHERKTKLIFYQGLSRSFPVLNLKIPHLVIQIHAIWELLNSIITRLYEGFIINMSRLDMEPLTLQKTSPYYDAPVYETISEKGRIPRIFNVTQTGNPFS